MKLEDAYNNGYYEGTSIMYDVIVENPNMGFDEAIEEVQDIELNKRQFSPFEFIAKEINEEPNSDEVWEKYEQGIDDGANEIFAKLRQ